MSIPGRADALVQFLKRELEGACIRLVFEASCFGYWTYDALVGAGVGVLTC